MKEEYDMIDVLLKLGIFASYVVFGVCVWLLRKDLRRWLKIDEKKGKRSKKDS